MPERTEQNKQPHNLYGKAFAFLATAVQKVEVMTSPSRQQRVEAAGTLRQQKRLLTPVVQERSTWSYISVARASIPYMIRLLHVYTDLLLFFSLLFPTQKKKKMKTTPTVENEQNQDETTN